MSIRNDGFLSGVNDWKHISNKLIGHHNCKIHRDAQQSLANLTFSTPVIQQLAATTSNHQQRMRSYLQRIIEALKMITAQGLALRGKEAEDGNFIKILKLMSMFDVDEEFKKWIERNNDYRSPEIINELIDIMKSKVVEKLLTVIKKSGFFGIVADTSRDITRQEQLAICIRYVDELFNVNEVLVAMKQLQELDADGYYDCITQTLDSLSLNSDKIRGQGYDGAAVMSGKKNGVAAKFLQQNKAAVYTHCQAHSLQLAVKDLLSFCSVVTSAYSMLSDIYEIIRGSPTRFAKYTHICAQVKIEQNENNEEDASYSITSHCPTRFSCNIKAIKGVKHNYEALYLTIQDLATTKTNSISSSISEKLHSCYRNMQQFQTILGIIICEQVFESTDMASKKLQSVNITAQSASDIIDGLKSTLSELRQVSSWNNCWQEAMNIASKLDIEPELPRKRKINKRYDEGSNEHEYANAEAYFRRIYIEAIDAVSSSINDRLSSETLELLSNIESIIIKACQPERKKEDVQIPEMIMDIYENDIAYDELEAELLVFNKSISSYHRHTNQQSNIRSIHEVITFFQKANSDTIALYPNIQALLRLYLTPPLTSCTAERSFSAMRRIKTWLRSTMTQQRFENLMILHVHKELTEEINSKQVLNEFISRKESRKIEFGNVKKI